MHKPQYLYILYFLALAITSSCTVGKHLDQGTYIYTGTKLNFADEKKASSIDNFKRSIREIPEAGTNAGVGNIYLGLYDIYEETGDRGFKHWVKYKLGSKPILYEKAMVSKTSARLSYYLNGKGFFAHELACDTTIHQKLATIDCDIELGNRYVIDSIYFPVDSTYAALKLDEKLKRTILEEGSYYDRDRLDYERVRLATLAGENGFVDFRSDNVHYYVDTAQMNNTADLYIKIIQPSDSTSHIRYVLDTIKIYPNYTLSKLASEDLTKVKVNDRMYVYESNHYLDHSLLERMILQQPNGYFNLVDSKKSVNRLLDLNLFRYINVNNVPSTNKEQNHFNQEIFLTPDLMQSISGELELNNRSGNFFGTAASLKYLHRNFFSQAAQLNASISGQVETQFGNGVSFINSSDVNGEVEISLPKMIIPFVSVDENRNYVPRTVFETNYTFQRRTAYYTLQSLVGRFGYKWREKPTVYHELYPLSLNQVGVFNKSAEFEEILNDDARLISSFQDILIAGLQYKLTYNDQSGTTDNQYSQFIGEVETSGNLLNLFSKRGDDNRKEILGLPFAQFFKITGDYRRYLQLKKSTLAARIILGAGVSYGNSQELPYIKQYLIGGSNSIRAFRLRGLGPGSFFIDPSGLDAFASQFLDQTGDLKLEMNFEHRFPLFSYLKGATFIDAGNIWLISNPERPESTFQLDQFYKQIAIGTGFGFRLDFDFFVIRLDLAFQLRGPTVDNDFQWKLNTIDMLSADWRSENIIYNLGIGYPF